MDDFIELMDFCSYDVDAAIKRSNKDMRPLREIINEMLEEAGLDAVASLQSEPIPAKHN